MKCLTAACTRLYRASSPVWVVPIWLYVNTISQNGPWCVLGPAAVGVKGRAENALATTLAYLLGLFFRGKAAGSEIAIGEPIGEGIGKPLRFHIGGNL